MTTEEFIKWLKEYLTSCAGTQVEEIRERLDQIKK